MDLSLYAEQRYKDGLECARKATQYDQQGHFSGAMAFYSEAVEALSQACSMAPMFAPIMDQVMEYGRRAEEIRQYLSTAKAQDIPRKPSAATGGMTERDKRYMNQIEYLLDLALLDDKRGRRSEASKMYSCAIEVALEAQKAMTRDADKQKVKIITMEALDRLEKLKLEPEHTTPATAPSLDLLLDNMPTPPAGAPQEGSKPAPGPSRRPTRPPEKRLPRGPLISFLDADSDLTTGPKFNAYSSGPPKPPSSTPSSTPSSNPSPRPHSPHSTMGRMKNKMSDSELKVLRATSVINGVTYYPWSDTDLSELRTVSSLPQDYKDPVGLIPLANKQKAQLGGWMRPHDICDNPKMVHLISSLTIKQSIIGDCSFIASLAVSADYEKRFKTRLVTRCIFPQNRNGEPIINPNGKYLICLNLNGCKRKVVIDDRLPVGRYGELLCSYSSSRDEFWISLIEKAYMKVMGGYDFPGSSSNIDLHALTGWIPERIGMKDAEEATFKKMEQTLRRGDSLLSVATGPLSEAQSERAGLVPTHAYAVLNVIEIKGLKLLQLKNPWSHKRWKGNFSEHDKSHWTPELRKALNFDQNQALQIDNGVFWIDWKSLKTFYDVIYINWRPEIFRQKFTVHDVWKPSNVEKDWYDISNNPQYSLKVNCTDQTASVWVLLSRHITTKSDFANNEKFITLHIAKSDGKRIYFPERFLVQGVKINTPHYLAKLEQVPRGSSVYTIIVSQLESLSTIHYTLRVYSTCDFVLTPVPNPYLHSKQLRGDWRPGQKDPPKFKYTNPSLNSHVMVKLQAPKELVVRLEMVAESQGADFKKVDSGPLRPGFTVLEASAVPKGTFAIMPSTWSQLPPKPVPFFVTLYSDNVFNFGG